MSNTMRVRTEADEFEMLVIAVSVDAMSASMSSATSSIRTSFTIEVGEVVDAFQNFFCSSSCRKQDLGEFFRNFSKFFRRCFMTFVTQLWSASASVSLCCCEANSFCGKVLIRVDANVCVPQVVLLQSPQTLAIVGFREISSRRIVVATGKHSHSLIVRYALFVLIDLHLIRLISHVNHFRANVQKCTIIAFATI